MIHKDVMLTPNIRQRHRPMFLNQRPKDLPGPACRKRQLIWQKTLKHQANMTCKRYIYSSNTDFQVTYNGTIEKINDKMPRKE